MNWKYLHLFGLLFIILVAGCAVPRTTAVLPEPRPLVEDYEPILPPSPPEAGNIESYQQQTPSGVITLQEALSLALLQNPTLAAFSYEIRAAEARALQANLYPNPEVGIELENFAGSGSFKGSGEMESTLLLGQSILLGGKRSKAVRAAALEGDLFAWDYEAVRMDVFTDVRLAFLEALAAQQRVELNEELVQLAEQLLQTIKRRVKAGKISPAELSRAQVRLSNQQVDLQLAQQELKAARLKLASTWGGKSVTFTSVSGVLDRLIKLPKLKQLQSLLSQNPDIARYEIALKQRQAVIALEDARRIPDPTLSGGIRRLNGANDNAFVAGLSIPLPLSDRNQGARQEARIRLAQTLREKQAVEVQLNSALAEVYNKLQGVYSEAIALQEQILPEAQKAFETINEGYLQGRFNFLDVLDAQGTLFDVRSRYLNVLKELHQSVAILERFAGQSIEGIK